ncbi:MAG: ATP-binding cassette domain-containing protein, partial [Clostridiales bacterium]|nr:ATP-binding cassette domain-containing protein [Clostridiales bacterium]
MREIMEEKKAVKFSLKIWSRLFPYFRQVKKHMSAVMIFMFASALTEASFPLFTRFAVNNFVMTGTTKGLFAFAAVFLSFIIFEGYTVLMFARHSIRIEMFLGGMLKRSCFVHLQELPLSFYNSTSVGFLIARVMSDTDRISGMVAWGFAHAAWNVCYILGSLIFMLLLNWKLALLLLAVIPLVLLITFYFQKRILAVNRRIRAVNAQITGAYNEGITGAKTSKTLVIEDKNIEEFSGLTKNMYRESVKSAMLSSIMLPLVLFCGSIAVGIALYSGGTLVMDRLLDYGMLSAFLSYAIGIIEPVVQTTGIFTETVSAQVGIERVTALLDEPKTISDTPEVVEKYGDVFNPKRENWEKIKGDITFENVWFRYPGSEEYILEDFSLHIPAGTTVALICETGAGKSTLVNLVCRFYKPTKGRILIDGRDYRERSQLWLHSSLGYVLQDPHLFSGTVMENIRYGRLDATDEEVVAAAKLVSADVVTARLPEGYQTEMGEGGDRLSTGE